MIVLVIFLFYRPCNIPYTGILNYKRKQKYIRKIWKLAGNGVSTRAFYWLPAPGKAMKREQGYIAGRYAADKVKIVYSMLRLHPGYD